MKTVLITGLAVAVFPSFASAQSSLICQQPLVLHIAQESGRVIYQLDGRKSHESFSLGEISSAARRCTPERAVFVIAQPDVPLKYLHLPGKEQISSDRYFIQYPTGAVQEIKFDLLFPKLPVTADITGAKQTIEEPPPPAQKVNR